MFEDKTFDALLREKLALLPASLDTREGSVIYDALAPNTLEAAMLYTALDAILRESYADTASFEYLVKRCAERGIAPRPATAAVALGEMNLPVPVGSRFSSVGGADRLDWLVTGAADGEEGESAWRCYLVCKTPGEAANAAAGRLIPVEYHEGLTSARIVRIVIPGENEEDAAGLKKRYTDSFRSRSYGFNRAGYIEAALSVPGVGGCKPYRAWKGPGTVGLVIQGSDYGVPSEELVRAVQTMIDPVGSSGDGMGIAPIGHEVTVMPVTGIAVSVSTSLTFRDGGSFDRCKAAIEQTVDGYFRELNAAWSGESALVVRISAIEARISALPGVLDITKTKLNGREENLLLPENAVAKRGEITNEAL